MDIMIIPKARSNDQFLIVDDEPEHIYWLLDYIEAKGFSTTLATNAEEAISHANSKIFRGYVIDLNIPLGSWEPNIGSPNPTYDKYIGLYIAKYIRTQGAPGRSVIAYSAHSNNEIKTEIELLYIEYVAKGRAAEFKSAINPMLTDN